jgi:hypothetical protein
VTKSTLVKYLGIYIDPVLSFKAHIGGTVRKCMFTNNTTNHGSSHILYASKSLYNALNISMKALNCQKFKKEVKKYFLSN